MEINWAKYSGFFFPSARYLTVVHNAPRRVSVIIRSQPGYKSGMPMRIVKIPKQGFRLQVLNQGIMRDASFMDLEVE